MHPHEIYHPSSTDADLLPVVDENDVVVGSATRGEVHRRKLRHRAVHIVVLDAAGAVILQKRSAKKDSHPGWWDVSVGGHVDVGEEYHAAAVRELREELGIENAPIREVARRDAAPESGWEFVRIYECVWTGPPPPFNRDEIDALKHWPARDLIAEAHSEPDSNPDTRITSSGLASIRLWHQADPVS